MASFPIIGLLAAAAGGSTDGRDPPLPFVAGEMQIIQQVGHDGRQSCFVRGAPASFRQAASMQCRQPRIVGAGTVPIADPGVQTTMVIRILPSGQRPAPSPPVPGEIMTDEEAELIVLADGSMQTCRSLRRIDRAEPRPWGDGVCNSLRRSGPRPFIAVGGAGSRRGIVRVTYSVYTSPTVRAAAR